MSIDNDDNKFKIPDDFPKPIHTGAVGGSQPKFLVVMYNGRFYEPGATPPELYERWTICRELAEQLVRKALLSKNDYRAQMSDSEILEQYFRILLATKWTSEEEARWVVHTAALKLEWEILL